MRESEEETRGSVTLKFTQLEQRTPNWALFIVQFFPLAPIAVVLMWLLVGYLIEATGALHTLKVSLPPDVKSDVNGAATLLVSSFIAGLCMGAVWPSLRASGRWIFLPSLPVAVGFAFKWRQYLSYNSRNNWFLTLLDWVCDPSMYIPYGYIGYSVAMAVLLRVRNSVASVLQPGRNTGPVG